MCCLFLVTFAFAGYAQGVEDTVLLQSTLDEITVVSSRLPTAINEASRTLYYQDLGQINAANQGLSVDEALKFVPGVFAQDAQNFAQDVRIAIRGFGARSAFGIRGIKVLVDGIPTTTPDGQTQLDQLSTFDLDRLEVMAGAVGGLYGNASGGAIAFHTRRPKKDRVLMRSNVGSYGFLKTNVQLAKVGEKAVWELGGDHMQISGYRAHNASRTSNLFARTTLNTQDGLYQFYAGYTNSPEAMDPGGITLQDAQADRRQARQRNVDFRGGESLSQYQVSLLARRQLKSDRCIEAKTYYVFRDFENFLPFENGGSVAFERNFYGANIQYAEEHTRHDLLIGAETERQSDRRMRFENLRGIRGALSTDQQEIFNMTGLYVLQKFRFLPRLSTEVNLRLDVLKVEAKDYYLSDGDQSGSISWNHLSPSVGFNYQLHKSHHLYFMAGHSFETPALSELSNDPGGMGGFNQQLEPQLANHFELGLKHHKSKVSYSMTLFYIRLKNELLAFEIEAFPGRTFYRNAGKSRRKGLELSLHKKIAHWNFLMAYTFSDFGFTDFISEGNDYSGNRISGIPKHFLNSGLQYDRGTGVFYAIDFSRTGKLYVNDQNSESAPGYSLLHVRGGWNFGLKNIRLKMYAGVRNITDAEYFDNVRINAFGGRYYEPAPGRNYFGGIEVEF